MSKKLIAFCGPKGSGKSTACTIFSELYEHPVEEMALAGKLKDVCSKIFNLDYSNFIDPKKKERELETFIVLNKDNISSIFYEFGIKNIDHDNYVRRHLGKVIETPRRLLQYVGTDILHPYDKMIHVKNMTKDLPTDKLIVITDLRFQSEFEYFESDLCNNFQAVFVNNNKASIQAENDRHPSEREVFNFKNKCLSLDNNGSKINLTANIKSLIRTLKIVGFL